MEAGNSEKSFFFFLSLSHYVSQRAENLVRMYPAGHYTQPSGVSAVTSQAASMGAGWCVGKCASKCLCCMFATKAAVKSHGVTWGCEGSRNTLGSLCWIPNYSFICG